jgi:RES domain
MSPNIWTLCGAKPNVVEYRGRPSRIVEDQHHLATRPLVDSVEEHDLLEQLIENAKPPARAPAALDYLLSTPLRYPPLKRGSRFGTTLEMGIWYGAEEPRTAFAEVAYYLVVLLEGTAADIQPLQRTVTAFTADVKSTVAVDLTLPPFATHGADISAKDSYVSSQQLGLDMRAAGTTAFRFTSARDIRGGVNVGVFSPSAFASKKSKSHQRWLCVATTARVEFTRQGVVKTAVHSFPRADFLIGEALPTPAI